MEPISIPYKYWEEKLINITKGLINGRRRIVRFAYVGDSNPMDRLNQIDQSPKWVCKPEKEKQVTKSTHKEPIKPKNADEKGKTG